MNYDKISNQEDLAFLKSVICKLENYKCNASFVFIYNSLETKLLFEEISDNDKIKLINFAYDCYMEMNICDLDVLCGAIVDYCDEILDETYDKWDIMDFCLDRQSE